MKIPALLRQGDRVSVIAPSGLVNQSACEEGIAILGGWGLNVERGKNLYSSHGLFAGSDDQRLSDLQQSLDDPGIRAIFCARGGYGLSRIIDRIDLAGFKKNPKWIIGYSDITILHLWINMHCQVATLHGEMVARYSDKQKSEATLATLQSTLFNGLNNCQWESSSLVRGNASGVLAGGNLSLLCNLTGTGINRWLEGKILFIEETGEYLYRLDRMLTTLKLSGIFDRIGGMIIGGLTGMEDTMVPFGKGPDELVMEAVSGYGFPVAMDFQAGHINDNHALVTGAGIELRVSDGRGEIIYL